MTGSAHGIGAAIASSVADEGAKVILADVDSAAADTAAIGGAAEFHALDVCDAKRWADVVADVTPPQRRIDGLVNNASVHGLQIIPASLPHPEGKHGLIACKVENLGLRRF